MYDRCPSYGVMTPIWLGTTPDLKNFVTIFSTLDASVLGKDVSAGARVRKAKMKRACSGRTFR